MSSASSAPDITSGSLWSNIWHMSWPMFIVMLMNFGVGFIDIYVAGFLGPDIQAAVGYVSQIYFFIVIAANAISIGTLVLISRAIGAKDYSSAVNTARQSLLFGTFIAIVLGALGYISADFVISISGIPPHLHDAAASFLTIFAIALAPNYLLIIATAIFRAGAEMKKVLIIMGIVSVLTAAGDFALVFGFGPLPALGYIGIALATALAFTVGLILSLILMYSSTLWRHIFSTGSRVSLETIRRIVIIGWPAVLLQLTWNSANILLYNILSALGDKSVTALASLTNGLRIEAVIYLPAFALNMAASVLIGQNLGAGNPARAEKLAWKIMFAGIGVISAASAVIFIFAGTLAGLVTDNPDVAFETARYLRLNMLVEPFMAMSVILGGALQGAGDTKGVMMNVFAGMWLVRLPLAYLLAITAGLGALGAWIGMITSMTIQGILMGIRFKKGGWKHIRF
ncbi:MAG: MATE family efflux transporter [Nitrospiraceae bacterium]|nr:MATE family efflux transporter [Nitrospiraceae bacterium]